MQKTLFSFFNKAPKPQPQSQAGEANVGKKEKTEGQGGFPAGSLVWSKLPGYPWWPSMVCNHPTTGKTTRKGEIHVQFLDTPVTRSWVSKAMVKRWGEKVSREGGPGQPSWEAGLDQAEKAAELSNEERLERLLVTLLPSDEEEEEEWSDEEVSPGSKENKKRMDEPQKKRRRIIELDSDDSDGDESFKPSKADMEDQEEEEESSGDSEAEPTTGEDEPASSPEAGSKKRKLTSQVSGKSKKGRTSPDGDSSLLATPVGKFVSSLVSTTSPSPSSTSLFSPGLSDSTKKKLAMFGASGEASPTVQYSHNRNAFLKPGNIRDADKRTPDDPDYNPRTLHVPKEFLDQQTPAQRQWWVLKSKYYDVILFFKMGKFYELFHMDADVGVTELNLIYMKGDVAHAGFPEVAFSRYSSTLVEKGYKVARIEQTETPAMMEERLKKTAVKSKFDKVVEREVCQVTTKGTRINNFLDRDDFQGEPSYLLAIMEKPGGQFGVAFIDTTLGTFNLSQFTDDKNLSRLRTLAANYPPSEVLYPRGSLSSEVETFLQSSLSAARKESLRPGQEFWGAAKTLKVS